MKKVSAAEIERRVNEALELVQLPQLRDRRPKQLSGGQQQRVALARALVNRPQVLLLDEPLGALDLKLRKAMQLELKQIQAEVGITFIYVTHDQEEALTMSNRIAVMNDGVVQQVGTPRDIYEHPYNRFVADFIGETNFITSVVSDIGEFVTASSGGITMLGIADGRELKVGQKVSVAVRPEKMELYPIGEMDVLQTEAGIDAETSSKLFGRHVSGKVDAYTYLAAEKGSVVLKGMVDEAIYIGTDTRYRVRLTKEVVLFVRMQNFGSRYDTPFKVGDEVFVFWIAENAQVLTE